MVVKLSSVLCFSGAHPSLEPLPDVVELLSLSLSPTAMQEELAPHHAIRLHESFSQDYFMVWFFHVCCLTGFTSWCMSIFLLLLLFLYLSFFRLLPQCSDTTAAPRPPKFVNNTYISHFTGASKLHTQTDQRKRKSLPSYWHWWTKQADTMLRKKGEQILLKKLHEMFIC